MQRYNKTYKWFLTVLLLWSFTVASAFTYTQPTPQATWSKTPTLSTDARPSYTFRSTSTCTPVVGRATYISTPGYASTSNVPHGTIYRANPWDEEGDPDDNPIGVVDDPAPIGDTPWLLFALFALAYLTLRAYRTKKSKI